MILPIFSCLSKKPPKPHWVGLLKNPGFLNPDGKHQKTHVSLTLKFSGFRAVVKIRVPAEFHQAACRGSQVIVVTEKKPTETIQSVATAPTVITANTSD